MTLTLIPVPKPYYEKGCLLYPSAHECQCARVDFNLTKLNNKIINIINYQIDYQYD